MKFTKEQYDDAKGVGTGRNFRGRKLNRSEPHGTPPNALSADIEAAAAELAVSLYTGLPWKRTLSPDYSGDVGDLEVRWSSHDNGCLILHPSDPMDRVYVFVTGREGEYVLRGWILGVDGMRKEYWRDPTGKNRPAFFVPQSALSSMRLL